MSGQPDHELEVLEEDQSVPPRPEELIADAGAGQTTQAADQPAGPAAPAASNAD